MSKIGIKPESKTVDKGIVRTQKLIDDLRREIETLKATVETEKARMDKVYSVFDSFLG